MNHDFSWHCFFPHCFQCEKNDSDMVLAVHKPAALTDVALGRIPYSNIGIDCEAMPSLSHFACVRPILHPLTILQHLSHWHRCCTSELLTVNNRKELQMCSSSYTDQHWAVIQRNSHGHSQNHFSSWRYKLIQYTGLIMSEALHWSTDKNCIS